MGKKTLIGSMLIIFLFTAPNLYCEEEKYGINQNQPIPLGGWIYRTYFVARTPKSEHVEFTILYVGVEGGNIWVATFFQSPVIKIFKIPLDSNKQAFLNKTDSRSTLLLTVVDDHNRITVKETEYRDAAHIRFYPDLQQAEVYMSEDFNGDMPIFGTPEKKAQKQELAPK